MKFEVKIHGHFLPSFQNERFIHQSNQTNTENDGTLQRDTELNTELVFSLTVNAPKFYVYVYIQFIFTFVTGTEYVILIFYFSSKL